MENVKKIVKRNDVIFVFMLFIIMFIIPSFCVKLFLYDHLWNFTNVYKMVNGYKIYKECNVIITPLFFYIGEIILKIFGANYFGFNVYSMLINAFLYTNIYCLFKCFDFPKNKSFLYSMLILIISNEMLVWGANYNNLAIAFSILGINLLLKKKSYFWQGIVIFLVFMTKQNIGVYYAIGITIGRLWSQTNIKTTIKETTINAITAGLLLLTYIFYLYCIGSMYDFFDLVLFGISEFASQNVYVNWNNIGIIAFQAVLVLFAIFVILNQKVQIPSKTKSDFKTILGIVVMFLLIEYPILNDAHFILASLLVLVMYILIFENIIVKDFLKSKKTINILAILSIFLFVIIWVLKVSPYFGDNYEMDIDSPYYGIKLDKETRQSMNTVCEYIVKNKENGNNTIIYSYKADLYVNVLKLSNNKFDLPFLGNLGGKGENGIIEELDKLKNTHILVSKNKLIVQESKKVVDYIKDNFKLIGEVDEFYIYESHDM